MGFVKSTHPMLVGYVSTHPMRVGYVLGARTPQEFLRIVYKYTAGQSAGHQIRNWKTGPV